MSVFAISFFLSHTHST